MGATELASACAALEDASTNGDVAEARQRLAQVEAELERATTALRAEAGTEQPP